jgi:hypothetical protein
MLARTATGQILAKYWSNTAAAAAAANRSDEARSPCMALIGQSAGRILVKY